MIHPHLNGCPCSSANDTADIADTDEKARGLPSRPPEFVDRKLAAIDCELQKISLHQEQKERGEGSVHQKNVLTRLRICLYLECNIWMSEQFSSYELSLREVNCTHKFGFPAHFGRNPTLGALIRDADSVSPNRTLFIGFTRNSNILVSCRSGVFHSMLHRYSNDEIWRSVRTSSVL